MLSNDTLEPPTTRDPEGHTLDTGKLDPAAIRQEGGTG